MRFFKRAPRAEPSKGERRKDDTERERRRHEMEEEERRRAREGRSGLKVSPFAI